MTILARHSLVAACIVAFLTQSSVAQDSAQRNALVGLRAVRVVVANIGDEIEQLGLRRLEIQTDVELRLRKAGIPIVSDRAPSLYININIFRSAPGERCETFPYSTRVELVERVTVEREHQIQVVAPIWFLTSVGAVGSSKLRAVRDHIGDDMDQFIDDYLAANPRQKRD